ncbi:MAG TPA: LacI family DNA-binding transcriptional regulator [Polyangiales bacterium]|nr:LacI family DNA-binding transcriptional regulator [Polyangiales bacterium]
MTAVARRAQVSIATVSYVLNGVRQSRIPEVTQMRVRQAARELGYVPNESARSLRTGRSNLIIAHVPGGTLMLQRAAAGLDRLGSRLRAVGYTLVLHNDASLRGLPAAQLWCALRPTAVITAIELLTKAGMRLLESLGIVVVGMGPKPASNTPTLVLDDTRLGELAVEHLVARGCRDLVLIRPRELQPRVALRNRLAGARRVASRTRGVRVRTLDMALDAADAARLVERWDAAERPEGVFGFDDSYSALLLGALLDRGIRVPAELALIGADDSPICSMLRPRLSSVAIDLDSIERSMFEPLLAAIRGEWTANLARLPWSGRIQQRET